MGADGGSHPPALSQAGEIRWDLLRSLRALRSGPTGSTGGSWASWIGARGTHEAHALAAQLTDSLIDASVQRLPARYREIEGPRLAGLLRQRRNRLPQAAWQVYQMLARDRRGLRI